MQTWRQLSQSGDIFKNYKNLADSSKCLYYKV